MSAMYSTERPMAGPGLISYRYRGPMGWIMIGARDHQEALREAARSTTEPVSGGLLQVWGSTRYVDAFPQPAPPVGPTRVYADVFGALNSWYAEVRTLDHQRIFLGNTRMSSHMASVDAAQFIRRNGHQQCPKPTPEDEAFERYDFGEGITVEGMDGWERTSSSQEITRKVFVRFESDPPDAATRVASFTAVVVGGYVQTASASLDGDQIGHLPGLGQAGPADAPRPQA